MDNPVVNLQDKLLVDWPSDDGSFRTLKGKVIEINKTNKIKYNSKYKYVIRFKGFDDSFETRLIHLKYQVIDKSSKRKADTVVDCNVSFPPLKRAQFVASVASESLKYIVAPMVGASELAFRLLCRRYGASIAYTPMMNSEKFAVDEKYRAEEFQTVPEDRPLVAHFSANDPQTLLAAAKHVERHCDAIG